MSINYTLMFLSAQPTQQRALAQMGLMPLLFPKGLDENGLLHILTEVHMAPLVV